MTAEKKYELCRKMLELIRDSDSSWELQISQMLSALDRKAMLAEREK